MGRFILGRVMQFGVVIFAAMTLVFIALQVVADPAALALPLGSPPEAYAEFRTAYGLNGPALERLVRYLGRALHGDLGRSIWLGGSAMRAVIERLGATALLVVPPTIIGGILGVAVGARAARRPNSVFANAANLVSYLFVSIAEFWLAIVLVMVFAVRLGWLPTGGSDPKPQTLILPMFVLALRPFAHNFQLSQTTMAAEYNKQYVMALRAKGLSESDISRRHVLRNVAVPSITLLLYELGRVFVGTAIVIELVFAWPGVGRLAVNALQKGDVFLVEAVVLVASLTTAVLNVVADLLYYAIDPRTRHLVKRRNV